MDGFRKQDGTLKKKMKQNDKKKSNVAGSLKICQKKREKAFSSQPQMQYEKMYATMTVNS